MGLQDHWFFEFLRTVREHFAKWLGPRWFDRACKTDLRGFRLIPFWRVVVQFIEKPIGRFGIVRCLCFRDGSPLVLDLNDVQFVFTSRRSVKLEMKKWMSLNKYIVLWRNSKPRLIETQARY